MTVTPAQACAARGLINWSQHRLAITAGVGLSTVADFKSGKRHPLPTSLNAMRSALEGAGVMFLARGRDGEGVRLRRVQPTTATEDGSR